MAISLQQYHFNSIKFGEITKQYAKSRGISKATLAGRVGVSYDTMDCVYRGSVQKISFELVFKIACVLAVPLEVIAMLWIKDDDIDFREMILHYDANHDKTVLVPDDMPSFVPDAVADTAAAVAASEPPLAVVEPTHQHAEDSRIEAVYSAHVADLREQLAHERAINDKYQDMMQQLMLTMCAHKE